MPSGNSALVRMPTVRGTGGLRGNRKRSGGSRRPIRAFVNNARPGSAVPKRFDVSMDFKVKTSAHN